MKVLGVDITWPGYWRFATAVVIAVLLWSALTATPLAAKDASAAGAQFAAILFGCVSNACGIELKRGGRHLLLNIVGCGMVLVAYHLVAPLIN